MQNTNTNTEPQFTTKKINRFRLGKFFLRALKFILLATLRLFVLAILYFLKLTEFLSAQGLSLASRYLEAQEIGIKVVEKTNGVSEDQFVQKYTEEELRVMAKQIDGMTLQEIQDEFDVSYRIARKIKTTAQLPSFYKYGQATA